MSSVSQPPFEMEPGKIFWRRRQPCPELAGKVTDIVGYHENGQHLTGSVEMAALVVPLVISFGAPFQIALGRKPRPDEHYASFTSGLFPGHVKIESSGDSTCIQINFTPLAAYRFFGLPMRELSSRMVRLDDLADREIALLRRRLEDTEDWELRLDIAEAFVVDRLRQAPPPNPAVVSAYRELAFCHGNIRILAIAGRLGFSRKHLSQLFQEEIGLAPKGVARIMRFNRLLDLAKGRTAPNWADLAAECCYADQAHLTREFTEFAGSSPRRWQAAT